MHRHDAPRRLEAEQAAEARRDADRAAAVGGDMQARPCRAPRRPLHRRCCRPASVRVSHGFRVTPVSGLSVTPFQPNSGVVVLPRNTAPCSRMRATGGAVFVPRLFRIDGARAAQRRPAFGENQILHRGRHAVHQSGRFAALPARLGLARARSALLAIDHARKRCKSDSACSMRSSAARVTSTGDSRLAAVVLQRVRRRTDERISSDIARSTRIAQIDKADGDSYALAPQCRRLTSLAPAAAATALAAGARSLTNSDLPFTLRSVSALMPSSHRLPAPLRARSACAAPARRLR